MSLKNMVLSLCGVSYDHPEIAPKSTEYRELLKTSGSHSVALRPVVQPIDQVMAAEETTITEIRRREYRSDAPILSAQDQTVQSVSFRNNPAMPVDRADRANQIRRARVEAQHRADAPVEPRPLIAAPQVEPPIVSEADAWRRSMRYPAIQRKSVA